MTDATCEHGTAMDVHCCNCHHGFVFDHGETCVCEPHCRKCNRVFGDLIHDVRGHQGTGCSAVHAFIGSAEQHILEIACRIIGLAKQVRPKGKPTDEMRKWNAAIDAAGREIENMYLTIDPVELIQHDNYFADEYAAIGKT